MKRFLPAAALKRTLALSLALGLSPLASSAAAPLAPGEYAIDPMHSKVGFEIAHLVISTVDGRFTDFEGKLDIAKDFQKSKANISVNIASIDTGVAKRDEHLRSPDFFDTKKFPKMTFISRAFEGSPEAFKLVGDLTIRGVTKKVALDAKYLGTVKDGYGNQKAAFKAETKISRKDFGLTWNSMVEAGPTVGDEVTIKLQIQAAATAPAAKK